MYSEINQISLNNHDGICSGNLRKVSEHLRDYFQLSCAPMPMVYTIRKHYNILEARFASGSGSCYIMIVFIIAIIMTSSRMLIDVFTHHIGPTDVVSGFLQVEN